MNMQTTAFIETLSSKHKDKFLSFSDLFIGKNYFNENNFNKLLELSTLQNLTASFVLLDTKSEIIGVRVTYVPGKWMNEISMTHLKNINVQNKEIAYFKSLFIHKQHQGKGYGPMLTNKSMQVLKQMGAKAILTHSWLESPNNSSVKYLENMGFQQLGLVKNFWIDFDYTCSGCGLQNCTCTAVEMILML